jgi:hypothetical protein
VGIVIQAMMLALMVFVCATLGWLWVAAPRKPKDKEQAAAKTKAAPQARKAEEREAPKRRTRRRREERERESEGEERRRRREKAPAVAPPAEPERPTPPPSPEAAALSWEKDVLPIMQRACISCHGGGKKRGGLDLRTFAALLVGGDNGPGVKAGNPDDSPLYESIASDRMPPGRRKLSAAQKKIVRDWIAGGAKGAKGM